MPVEKYLTRGEVERVIFSLDTPTEKTLIQLGLALGCRVSEITSIRLKNLHEGYVKLWDEKKDDFRLSVFDRETDALVKQYLRSDDWKNQPGRGKGRWPMLFYFCPKTANNIVKRVFKRAKVAPEKAHWHTLRHTYIVQSLDAGVPLNHIIEQTGDSPTTIINVYGRPSLDARIRRLDDHRPYWKVSQ